MGVQSSLFSQRTVSRLSGGIKQEIKVTKAVDNNNKVLFYTNDLDIFFIDQIPASDCFHSGIISACKTMGCCDNRLKTSPVAKQLPIGSKSWFDYESQVVCVGAVGRLMKRLGPFPAESMKVEFKGWKLFGRIV